MMTTCPSHTGNLLGNMLNMPPAQLWQHAAIIIKHFRQTFDPAVPRYIQGKIINSHTDIKVKLYISAPRITWACFMANFDVLSEFDLVGLRTIIHYVAYPFILLMLDIMCFHFLSGTIRIATFTIEEISFTFFA